MEKPRWVDQLIVWGNREPIPIIQAVLWVLLAGWLLFVYYVFAAIFMLFTLVFIPFVPQVLSLAVFTFNPVMLSPVRGTERDAAGHVSAWKDAKHPYTVAANIVWLTFIGWGAALAHVFLSLVQALTIIGLPTALQNLHIAWFVLWPFPFSTVPKFLPTTLAELNPERYGGTAGRQTFVPNV